MPLPDGFDAAHRLGRVPEHDIKSANFPVRELLDQLPVKTPRSYTWSCGPVLDQGNVGSCVGNAIADELAARPVIIAGVDEALALSIYQGAGGVIDPEHPEHEGTSILAGMKEATARGYYDEYRWAWTLEDLVLTLGYLGPVVLGISWYQEMFDPDADGVIHIGGPVAGGHGILANGVNVKRRLVRLHNSWGPGWGENGEAFISFDDLERLIHEGGDVAVPVRRDHPHVLHALGLLEDEDPEAPTPLAEADQEAQEDQAPQHERAHRVPRVPAPNPVPAYGTVV